MPSNKTMVVGREQDQPYLDDLMKDPAQFEKIFTCLGEKVPSYRRSSYFASHKDMAMTKCIVEAWLDKNDPEFLKNAKEWEKRMEEYATTIIPSEFSEIPSVGDAMRYANNYPSISSEDDLKSKAKAAFIAESLNKHAESVSDSIWETYWDPLTLDMRESYGDAYF